MNQPEATDDGKAHFDHIYDQPDPRAYYRTLGALDYEIPQRALPVVQTLVGALPRSERPGPPQVLDVCCSYGINAALLRYELTLDELHRRYADPTIDELSAEGAGPVRPGVARRPAPARSAARHRGRRGPQRLWTTSPMRV